MKTAGHTDCKTTANIYTHVRDEMLRKATVKWTAFRASLTGGARRFYMVQVFNRFFSKLLPSERSAAYIPVKANDAQPLGGGERNKNVQHYASK